LVIERAKKARCAVYHLTSQRKENAEVIWKKAAGRGEPLGTFFPNGGVRRKKKIKDVQEAAASSGKTKRVAQNERKSNRVPALSHS